MTQQTQPTPERRAVNFGSVAILIACLASSMVGGLACGFFVNSYIAPTLSKAATSCEPLTGDIAKAQDDIVNHELAIKTSERMLAIQSKMIDACVAQKGIPLQSPQNGNVTDCKKAPQ